MGFENPPGNRPYLESGLIAAYVAQDIVAQCRTAADLAKAFSIRGPIRRPSSPIVRPLWLSIPKPYHNPTVSSLPQREPMKTVSTLFSERTTIGVDYEKRIGNSQMWSCVLSL